MATVVAAYVAVWLGAALYVAWLGRAQRRTARRVQALASHLDELYPNRQGGSQTV